MSRKIKRVFYERNQGKILGRNQGAKGSFKKKTRNIWNFLS